MTKAAIVAKPSRHLGVQLPVRVSREERAYIAQEAKRHKMTVARWCRTRLQWALEACGYPVQATS